MAVRKKEKIKLDQNQKNKSIVEFFQAPGGRSLSLSAVLPVLWCRGREVGGERRVFWFFILFLFRVLMDMIDGIKEFE
jgi:hypothetical protein